MGIGLGEGHVCSGVNWIRSTPTDPTTVWRQGQGRIAAAESCGVCMGGIAIETHGGRPFDIKNRYNRLAW